MYSSLLRTTTADPLSAGLITTSLRCRSVENFNFFKCFCKADHLRKLNALFFVYNDHFKKANIYCHSSLHVILYGGATRLVMSIETIKFALMLNK